MHATTVLQKCLGGVFEPMHAARRRTLLGAVTAMLNSRQLILMELARAWPGAERVRAPLKRLDRLLGNPYLTGEAPRCYAAMARWLVRTSQPIVVVDWSELKADGRWQLLRAGIPVGSRTLTVLEAVYPEQEKNTPRVERQFLERLRSVLPQGGEADYRDGCGLSGAVVSGSAFTGLGLRGTRAPPRFGATGPRYELDRQPPPTYPGAPSTPALPGCAHRA